MAKQILQNAKIWVAQYNLTGDTNSLAVELSADTPDATTLGDTTRTRLGGGLKVANIGAAGFIEEGAGLSGQYLFDDLAVSDKPVTVSPESGAETERAYILNSILASYTPKLSTGEIYMFDLSIEAQGDLVQGIIEINGTKTASGNSTGSQLGALSASQKVVAALHVLSASGTSPTLDVDIESDDNGSFTSATSRGSFTQATGATAELIEINGAVTDDYWRAAFTIGGTSPSFEIILSLGIV